MCVTQMMEFKNGSKGKNKNLKIISGNNQLLLQVQQSLLTIISSQYSNSAEVVASDNYVEGCPEQVLPKCTTKVNILDLCKT